MTLSDLISLARDRFDDELEPYRWSDSILVSHFNEAEREACRRAHLIIDKTNAMCRVLVKAGNPLIALNSKVIRIRSLYLGAYLRGTLSWDAALNSLLDTGNGFITAGFLEGDQFIVMGFTGATNNGILTVSSVSAGAIVVVETGIVTNETCLTAIAEVQRRELIKKTKFELDDTWPGWNTYNGEPDYYTQDEDGEIRLVGLTANPSTAHLVVSRLPLADMVLTPAVSSPEVDTMYHYDLLDWVEHLAYRKDDADTAGDDTRRSAEAEARFTLKFGPRPSAKAEQFRKRYPREARVRPRAFGS